MESKQNSIWLKNKCSPYAEGIFNDSYHFVLLQYICNVTVCGPVLFLYYAFYYIDFGRPDMLADSTSAARKENTAECGDIVVWRFTAYGT